MRAANLVPDVQVSVNGSPLNPNAKSDVLSVAVHQDVDAAGMVTLRMINWDMQRLQVTWSDDALFDVGSSVEISMGYVDQLQKVFAGEITGLEPEFSGDDTPMLTVRGHDRRHRLMRGRKTRSFSQIKDSDIASQIAGDANLTPDTVDTGVTLEYVLQNNQTDWEFLLERARRIGYELVVEDRTMHFRPPQNAQQEVLTLEPHTGLVEFNLRLTSMTQAGKVEVHGWSPKDKAAIVGQAGPSALNATMGTASGPSAADRAFSASVVARVTQPVSSSAEADKMAQGQLNEMALDYIGGEGVCIGRADLAAGIVIKIQGIGRRFSGLYYVAHTRHTFSSRHGYRTAFTVRRNAS